MQSSMYVIVLVVGGWMVLNGVLHDIFILRSDHGKKYDRDLLRLLMDGHILITCGIMQMISAIGFTKNEEWAYYVAGAASVSLLIYCAMIFPFLKSIGTILINILLIVLMIYGYLRI